MSPTSLPVGLLRTGVLLPGAGLDTGVSRARRGSHFDFMLLAWRQGGMVMRLASKESAISEHSICERQHEKGVRLKESAISEHSICEPA